MVHLSLQNPPYFLSPAFSFQARKELSPLLKGTFVFNELFISLELSFPEFRDAKHPLSHPSQLSSLEKVIILPPRCLVNLSEWTESWWREKYKASVAEPAPPSKTGWGIAGPAAGGSVREGRATREHLCSQVWVRKTTSCSALSILMFKCTRRTVRRDIIKALTCSEGFASGRPGSVIREI